MTALYQWHPYELQAFVCGVIVGLLIAGAWIRRRR